MKKSGCVTIARLAQLRRRWLSWQASIQLASESFYADAVAPFGVIGEPVAHFAEMTTITGSGWWPLKERVACGSTIARLVAATSRPMPARERSVCCLPTGLPFTWTLWLRIAGLIALETSFSSHKQPA